MSLKEARLAAGLTQVELARKLDVTSQTISCYECGLQAPWDSQKIELSKLLNVSIDYFLGISDVRCVPLKGNYVIEIEETLTASEWAELNAAVSNWLSSRKGKIDSCIAKQTAKQVPEAVVYKDNNAYWVCPSCHVTFEREYQAYCDRCGQKLKWPSLRKITYHLRT